MVSEPGIQLGTQQLTTLLDSTRELIAILGQDGTVQFVNSTFQSVLGYRAEELLGRSLFAIVHALDVQQLRERLKQVAAQEGSSLTERCRVRAKDGSWRWLDVTYRDRLKEPGLEGIQLNALEVTHLNRMESERQVIAEIVHALNETSDLDQLLTRIHAALNASFPPRTASWPCMNRKRTPFNFRFSSMSTIPRQLRKRSDEVAPLTCFARAARN